MLKKIHRLAFLLLISPITAFAANFYTGLDLGYQIYNLNTRITTLGPIGTVDTNSYTKGTAAGNGFREGIFAGVGNRFSNNVYTAAELRASITNTTVKVNSQGVFNSTTSSASATENINSTIRIKQSYNISFKPGYFLTNRTVGYVILGYVIDRVSASGSAAITTTSSSGLINNSINSSLSKTGWQQGFQYGLGMQAYLTQNLALRTELRQISYKTYTFSRTSTTVKIHPVVDEGSVGLVWVFC